MGLCFLIEAVNMAPPEQRATLAANDVYGPVGGQVISAVKDACRSAFLAAPPRLMEAMLKLEMDAAGI